MAFIKSQESRKRTLWVKMVVYKNANLTSIVEIDPCSHDVDVGDENLRFEATLEKHTFQGVGSVIRKTACRIVCLGCRDGC